MRMAAETQDTPTEMGVFFAKKEMLQELSYLPKNRKPRQRRGFSLSKNLIRFKGQSPLAGLRVRSTLAI